MSNIRLHLRRQAHILATCKSIGNWNLLNKHSLCSLLAAAGEWMCMRAWVRVCVSGYSINNIRSQNISNNSYNKPTHSEKKLNTFQKIARRPIELCWKGANFETVRAWSRERKRRRAGVKYRRTAFKCVPRTVRSGSVAERLKQFSVAHWISRRKWILMLLLHLACRSTIKTTISIIISITATATHSHHTFTIQSLRWILIICKACMRMQRLQHLWAAPGTSPMDWSTTVKRWTGCYSKLHTKQNQIYF